MERRMFYSDDEIIEVDCKVSLIDSVDYVVTYFFGLIKKRKKRYIKPYSVGTVKIAIPCSVQKGSEIWIDNNQNPWFSIDGKYLINKSAIFNGVYEKPKELHLRFNFYLGEGYQTPTHLTCE